MQKIVIINKGIKHINVAKQTASLLVQGGTIDIPLPFWLKHQKSPEFVLEVKEVSCEATKLHR